MTTRPKPTRWLAAIACLLLTLPASAYDFMEGGIAYIINSDGTSVTVTYETSVSDRTTPSYSNASGTLVIPSSIYHNGRNYVVTAIGEKAFRNCKGFTGPLVIPNTVASLGQFAFSGCSGLTNLDIPNSVTTIGNYVFEYCSGLVSVSIPNSVSSIGSWSLSGCNALTSLTIPNSVTSIGSCAFADCSGLTGTLTIPNSVITIKDQAFVGCIGLASVTIGKSVKTIEEGVFSGCRGLTSIVVASDNAKYDSRGNCNAIIETASNVLICGCKNTVIPNSVTSIDYVAFEGCHNLVSITIPNSVTSIGSGAFYGCTNLTSIITPNSVTEIGYEVFSNCSKLAQVELGSGLRTIAGLAFDGCPAITDIICHSGQPAEIEDWSPFSSSIYSTATVHVPSGSLPNYSSAPVWMRFDHFVDDAVEVVKGDVNGDGRVDINDVNAVVNLILGRSTLFRDRADITGDGKVGVADLNAIINVMLGRNVN